MTPEELRDMTRTAQEHARAENERKQQEAFDKIAVERRKMLERVPEWIKYVEREMEKSANSGQLDAKVLVWNESNYDSKGSIVRPAIDKVIKHFRDKGYSVNYTVDNPMEWGSDGAGPGPDWHYFITVSWRG